ncbi:MAG: hypothetical protein DYG92_01630 [Leptolyngbya sp. PLA1]|nr:hypothetical protein [Leptolyngbya sp. PLA1]
MSSRPRTANSRRGGVLLEVLLALVLFVSAAMATLSLVDRLIENSYTLEQRRIAADLARSAMARLEAGLATPETLSGPVRPEEGDAGVAAISDWVLDVQTETSPFSELTNVSVTAMLAPGGDVEHPKTSFTLRQLVRLARRQPEPTREDPMSGLGAPAEGVP